MSAEAVPSSWGYLRPYRARMAIGFVMLVITNASYLGVPELTRYAVDHLGKLGRSDILTYILMGAGFAIVTALTRILSRVLIFNAARAAEYDLRSTLFGHLLQLSPGYFRKNSTGDVMSRLTNDVQTVRAMWGFGVLSLANAFVAFVSVIGAMLYHDPIVTLWAITPFPIIYFIGQRMSKRIFATMRDTQAQLGALSAKLQEDLGAIQVIKTYGLEKNRRDGFVSQSQKLTDRNMEAARVRITLGPSLNTLAAMGTGILILFGGRAMVAHDMTKGEMLAMWGYIAKLVWPTLTLGWMLALVQRGRASWARLVQIQAEKTEIPDGTGEPLPKSDKPATVEIKSLTIAVGERKLLDDVTFTLAPGTVTAVVGRTGAGKSTLVDALCRLVQVPAGTMFLDGRDVTTLPLASARAQIGYAPQEAFLFSTTIADNIAMGYGGGSAIPAARAKELEKVIGAAAQPDLSTEPRVKEAAETAGLARDLDRMPEGLGTIVGERGITLSGGQRQRVALARALAAKPRLLVLDDSLSSVDAETERTILKNLRVAMSGRTAVLISHRVAAIKDADQIIVLDGGKIVATGKHESLLAEGGLYAQLYRTQLDIDTVKKEAVA